MRIQQDTLDVIRQKCGQTLGLGLGQIRYSSCNYYFMMRERGYMTGKSYDMML